MKTIQKLELYFSFATLVTALLTFLFAGIIELTTNRREFNSVYMAKFLWVTCIIIIINLLFVFAAYIHAAKQNMLGLAAVIISGGVLSLYFGVLFFSGGAFYYYGAGGFYSLCRQSLPY